MKNEAWHKGLNEMIESIEENGFESCRDTFNRENPRGAQFPSDMSANERSHRLGEFEALFRNSYRG